MESATLGSKKKKATQEEMKAANASNKRVTRVRQKVESAVENRKHTDDEMARF